MNVIMLYKERSDHARVVSEFAENFRRRYPDRQIEMLDIETREGAYQAELYGVVTYPAVIVKDDAGAMTSMWQGEQLPLIDEVVALLLA